MKPRPQRLSWILASHLFQRRPSIHYAQTVQEFVTDGESVSEDSLCVRGGSSENLELISLSEIEWSGLEYKISGSVSDLPLEDI